MEETDRVGRRRPTGRRRVAATLVAVVGLVLVLATAAPVGAGSSQAVPPAQRDAEPNDDVPTAEIDPGFLLQGDPVPATITLRGTGTTFGPATTVRLFTDAGRPLADAVDDLRVADGSSLTFDVVRPLGAGNHTVRTVTDGVVTDSLLIVGRRAAEITPSTVWLPYTGAVLSLEVPEGRLSPTATQVEVRDERNRTVAAVEGFEVLGDTSARMRVVPGLAAGVYQVRLTTEGQQARETFSVQHPILEVTPQDLPLGYRSRRVEVATVGMTVDPGDTAVALLGADGKVVRGAVRRLAVHDRTHLSFRLRRGVPEGDYTLRVTSGGAVGSGLLVVRRPHAFLEPGEVDAGYPATTIGVIGTHTSFRQGRTAVRLLDAGGAPAPVTPGQVTVESPTALVFELPPGLPAGTYTVAVSTGKEAVRTELRVHDRTGAPEVFPEHLLPGAGSESFAVVRTLGDDVIVRGETEVEVVLGDGTPVPGGIRNLNVLNERFATFEFAPGLPAGDLGVRVLGPGVDATVPLTVGPPAVSELLFPEGLSADAPRPTRFLLFGGATSFADDITMVTLHDPDGAQVGEAVRPVVDNEVSLSGDLPEALAAGRYVLRVTTGAEVVETAFDVGT
jgi:hypothetical protein